MNHHRRHDDHHPPTAYDWAGALIISLSTFAAWGMGWLALNAYNDFVRSIF